MKKEHLLLLSALMAMPLQAVTIPQPPQSQTVIATAPPPAVPKAIPYKRLPREEANRFRDMMKAAEAGDAAALRQMVEAGAPADLALFCAVASHNKELVTEWLPKADINSTPWERCTPLYAAIGTKQLERHDGWSAISNRTESYPGQVEMVKLLLEHGANPNAASSYDGITPLMEAVRTGDTAVFFLLLEAGADVDQRAVNGMSALHYALLSHQPRMVHLLLGASARTDLTSTRNAAYGHTDIPLKSTPLHLAALLNNEESLRLLLLTRTAVDPEDYRGNTPFLHAASACALPLMERLADAGADVKHRNSYRLSAISRLDYTAPDSMWKPALNYLLKKGVSPQNTDLIPAAASMNPEALRLLLEGGSRADGFKDDESPLNALVRNAAPGKELDTLSCIQLLVSAGLDMQREHDSLLYTVIRGDAMLFHVLQRLGAPVVSPEPVPVNLLTRSREGWEQFPGRRAIHQWLITEGGLAEENARQLAEEKKQQSQAALHSAIRQKNEKAILQALADGADISLCTNMQTPLGTAVSGGNPKIVELLLRKGADPNQVPTTDKQTGLSPLRSALNAGNEQIVRLLLSHGADINQQGEYGESFLHIATGGNKVKFMELALAAGANPRLLTHNKLNALMMARTRELAEKLLSAAPDLLRQEDAGGNTALHLAAARAESIPGALAVVYELTGPDSRTPLTTVSSNCPGTPELVEYLLQKGMDANAVNHAGETPLMCAARRGSTEVCRLLLAAGADATKLGKQGRSALSYALCTGSKELITLLSHPSLPLTQEQKLLQAISAGDEDAVNRLHPTVQTFQESGSLAFVALQTAILAGHEETARMLIRRGANINSKNLYDQSQLICAVQENNADAVRMIIRLGAKPDSYHRIENNLTGTALQLAALRGNLEMVQLLYELGASLAPGNKSCLEHALRGEHEHIIRWVVAQDIPVDSLASMGRTILSQAAFNKQHAMAKLLLELGANPNGTGYHHETPLRWAIQHKDTEMVRLLLAAGASADHVDNYNRNHLYSAAVACPAEIIGMLIRAGAQVNRVCTDPGSRCSALINVCKFQIASDRAEAVRLLLEAGADPTLKDASGKTALDYARANGYTESAALLEKATAPATPAQ